MTKIEQQMCCIVILLYIYLLIIAVKVLLAGMNEPGHSFNLVFLFAKLGYSAPNVHRNGWGLFIGRDKNGLFNALTSQPSTGPIGAD